mmetsp:Transcript_729/g.2166  ORF Transcript_729/g.2166 Transcript_729/m.2166 type:complete len:210 (+) Transcript_729:335-964(+)
MLVSLHQRLVIGSLLPLSWQQSPPLLTGFRLPNADVHVVRAAEHVAGVAAETHRKDTLHALGVVHFAAVTPSSREHAHRSVVAPRHKLAPGGRVVHIHHRRHEILVHTGGLAELPHVVAVQVAVLIRRCEIEGLHRVPCHTIGASLHNELTDGLPRAQVIKRNGAIAACGCQHIRLCRVEAHGVYCIGTPGEGGGGLRPVMVPNVHLGP